MMLTLIAGLSVLGASAAVMQPLLTNQERMTGLEEVKLELEVELDKEVPTLGEGEGSEEHTENNIAQQSKGGKSDYWTCCLSQLPFPRPASPAVVPFDALTSEQQLLLGNYMKTTCSYLFSTDLFSTFSYPDGRMFPEGAHRASLFYESYGRFWRRAVRSFDHAGKLELVQDIHRWYMRFDHILKSIHRDHSFSAFLVGVNHEAGLDESPLFSPFKYKALSSATPEAVIPLLKALLVLQEAALYELGSLLGMDSLSEEEWESAADRKIRFVRDSARVMTTRAHESGRMASQDSRMPSRLRFNPHRIQGEAGQEIEVSVGPSFSLETLEKAILHVTNFMQDDSPSPFCHPVKVALRWKLLPSIGQVLFLSRAFWFPVGLEKDAQLKVRAEALHDWQQRVLLQGMVEANSLFRLVLSVGKRPSLKPKASLISCLIPRCGWVKKEGPESDVSSSMLSVERSGPVSKNRLSCPLALAALEVVQKENPFPGSAEEEAEARVRIWRVALRKFFNNLEKEEQSRIIKALVELKARGKEGQRLRPLDQGRSSAVASSVERTRKEGVAGSALNALPSSSLVTLDSLQLEDEPSSLSYSSSVGEGPLAAAREPEIPEECPDFSTCSHSAPARGTGAALSGGGARVFSALLEIIRPPTLRRKMARGMKNLKPWASSEIPGPDPDVAQLPLFVSSLV